MPYRGSSDYHKITKQETATGSNHRITVCKNTAKQFAGCLFKEVIMENGIFLLKSGCELNEKNIMAVR